LFADKSDNSIKIIDFGMSKFVSHRQYFNSQDGTCFYMAPEVLDRKYSDMCDMWSMGVVMFIMLFGYPPFHDANEKKIPDKIRKGFTPKVRENYGAWFPKALPVSDSARDLISKLLVTNPAERLTASEVLQHPWITRKDQAANPLSSTSLTNIASFARNCKLKKKLLEHLTRDASDSAVAELQKAFKAADLNGDGILSYSEIRGIVSVGSNAEFQQLVSVLDSDGDGTISYQELLMFVTQKKLLANEERIWQEFCKIDTDRSGTISAGEIKRLLGEDSVELIKEVDKNGDGMIDYDEFLSIWMNQEQQAALKRGSALGK
jgi:calcium-dependent protein kinase